MSTLKHVGLVIIFVGFAIGHHLLGDNIAFRREGFGDHDWVAYQAIRAFFYLMIAVQLAEIFNKVLPERTANFIRWCAAALGTANALMMIPLLF
jgi:hypothetical protein